MKISIIGLAGYKGSGKSTASKYLVDKYGYKELAFAEPLKEICRILFSFNDEQLYGSKKEKIDDFWLQSPRKIFQFIGTELFRDRIGEILPFIEDRFWISVLKRKILSIVEESGTDDVKLVISDIRFLNEYLFISHILADKDFLKIREGKGDEIEWNIKILEIIRNNIPIDDFHSSEQFVLETKEKREDMKDIIIVENKDTIEELYSKLDNLL